MEAGHRGHDISDKDWEKLLDVLIEDPDYEWLMIDASHGKAWRPLFHPKKTEKYRERTTGVFIASGIWLRTLFYTSSASEASQLGMQKIQPLF